MAISETLKNKEFVIFAIFASSEGSDITEIFPKFEKSQFPKLAKTKISEKTVTQGLTGDDPTAKRILPNGKIIPNIVILVRDF
jgi:hypothetical protein